MTISRTLMRSYDARRHQAALLRERGGSRQRVVGAEPRDQIVQFFGRGRVPWTAVASTYSSPGAGARSAGCAGRRSGARGVPGGEVGPRRRAAPGPASWASERGSGGAAPRPLAGELSIRSFQTPVSGTSTPPARHRPLPVGPPFARPEPSPRHSWMSARFRCLPARYERLRGSRGVAVSDCLRVNDETPPSRQP
jgi:hypothetical protein